MTDRQDTSGPFPDPRTISNRAEFKAAMVAMKEAGGWSWNAMRDACQAAGHYPGRSTFQRWFNGGVPYPGSEDVFTALLRAFGITDKDELDAWRELVRRLRPKPRVPIGAEPYRDLESFDVEHAEWFFGRETLVADLLQRIEQLHSTGGGALTVVGVSGAGKSSVLRAGVAAGLAGDQITGSGDWPVLFLPPGSDPRRALVEELADRLDEDPDQLERKVTEDPATAAELLRRVLAIGHDCGLPERPGALIVVDQFEQALTTETDEQDEALDGFFDLLAAMTGAGLGCVVVFGIRANLYEPALGNERLHALTGGRQATVRPMNEQDLRAVIEEPAKKAGAELDAGFTDLLIREVSSRRGRTRQEAGALPLLSHALHATWVKGGGEKMTVAHYNDIGGIEGAVAGTAGKVYAGLTESQQEVARRLFLRLVHVHDTGADVRRRLPLADLPDERDEPGLREVLERFVDQRLLTLHADSVEISHDAVLSAWPTLRDWLAEDRAGRIVAQKLEQDARDWDQRGRRDEDLPEGTRLHSGREWTERHPGEASTVATAYVEAGLQRSRHRIQRLRKRNRGLAALLAVAVTLAVIVFAQQRETARERDEAVSQAIANKVITLRGKDRSLADQLALAGYQISPTVEARSALLDATGLRPAVRMRGGDITSTMYAAAIDPTGTVAAAGVDTTVTFWSLADPAHPRKLPPLPDGTCHRVYALTFQPHGRLLAAACGDGTIHLWDTHDPKHPTALPRLTGLGAKVISASFSPDGTMLAAAIAEPQVGDSIPGSIRLWRVTNTTFEPVGPPLSVDPVAAAKSVSIHPGNDYLAVGTDSGKVQIWDIRTPDHPRDPITLSGPHKAIGQLSFSPDGRHLAACGQDAATFLWDTTDPHAPVPHNLALATTDTYSNAVAFSPDSTRLAVASSEPAIAVRIFDLATGAVLATLPHPSPATAVKFSPDGSSVITGANDAVARIWPVNAPELVGMTYSISATEFSPDGHTLAVSSADLRMFDVTDPQHPVLLAPPISNPDGFSGSLAFATDHRTFAESRGRSGTVQLYDVSDRHHPHPLGSPWPAHSVLTETLAISPDSNLLATGGRDNAVRLWNIRHRTTPVKLSTPGVFDSNVAWVAFNPRGNLLVAGSADRTLRLWNIGDPAHPAQLGKPLTLPHYVWSTVFSPDGTLLAVGLGDSTVRLYDLTNPAAPRQIGAPLTGPTNYIYSTAFTSTGTTLAAASTDGTVWLWDLTHPDTPTHIATLTLPTKPLFTLQFQPGTNILAAGGMDHEAWLWNTDPAAAAAQICASTGDPITEQEWNQYVPNHPYQPPCRHN